jgi:hypothetical protein
MHEVTSQSIKETACPCMQHGHVLHEMVLDVSAWQGTQKGARAEHAAMHPHSTSQRPGFACVHAVNASPPRPPARSC